MTDTTLPKHLEPATGADRIVRAPFASGWVRGLLEANNAWVALAAALAAWFFCNTLMADVPGWARDAMIGGALGGGLGFVVSGLSVFRNARAFMRTNCTAAERVIDEARRAGVPASGAARGCVVIHDTRYHAVEGLILDRAFTRAALISGGAVRLCQVGELRTEPADRPFWACVQIGNDPDFRAVVPASLVPSGTRSFTAP